MRAANTVKGRVLASMLLVIGCADSHTFGADTGTEGRDGGSCVVAGLARCDDTCGGEVACRATSDPYDTCIAGLCVARNFHSGNRNDSCGENVFCFDGRTCLLPPDRDQSFCVAEQVCDEGALVGLDPPCIWSDGTRRIDGAPLDVHECPDAPYPATPLCGGPCGDCPPFHPNWRPVDSNLLQPVCIGRSDTRGVGICGLYFVDNCRRGEVDGDDICVWGGVSIPEMVDTTCTCVVFRGADTPDGLSDFGWPSSEEGCRAYRALYPDQIECVVDRGWDVLP